MGYESCKNCANAKNIGRVIKCEVRGIIKTPPYTKCGNWERARMQSRLMEDDE